MNMPNFMPLFTRKGVDLPKPTQFMMAISDALANYWPLFLAGAVATVVAVVFGRHRPAGRMIIDWIKINAPVIGPMCRKVAISRSVRTLGTMLASGVSVLDVNTLRHVRFSAVAVLGLSERSFPPPPRNGRVECCPPPPRTAHRLTVRGV